MSRFSGFGRRSYDAPTAPAASAVEGNGAASTNGKSVAVASSATPIALPVHDPHAERGRTEFHSVFGDLAKGKRNWQLAFFGLLFFVTAPLGVGLAAVAAQSRVAPYVVEVDRLGRAAAFGPAEALRSTDRRVLTAQLAGFVRDVRTVVGDPAAQADMVRRAYQFVDQGAGSFLDASFTAPANDPRVLGQQVTRLVEVTSVLALPGTAPEAGPTATWKVSWTETTLPRGGAGLARAAAGEGYLTTRVAPPTTADRIAVNPLGLYVTAINWTQLAAGATAAAGNGPATSAPAPAPNAALPTQETP